MINRWRTIREEGFDISWTECKAHEEEDCAICKRLDAEDTRRLAAQKDNYISHLLNFGRTPNQTALGPVRRPKVLQIK
jgi:hypothetical protein